MFLRYIVVGGIAFVVDACILCFMQEVFSKYFFVNLYLSIAAGFIGGLLVNYFLSIQYIFQNQSTNRKERVQQFLKSAVIGVVGLIFTEIGMHIGIKHIQIHYTVVKGIVASLVLIWNYLARKYFVFRERG